MAGQRLKRETNVHVRNLHESRDPVVRDKGFIMKIPGSCRGFV